MYIQLNKGKVCVPSMCGICAYTCRTGPCWHASGCFWFRRLGQLCWPLCRSDLHWLGSLWLLSVCQTFLLWSKTLKAACLPPLAKLFRLALMSGMLQMLWKRSMMYSGKLEERWWATGLARDINILSQRYLLVILSNLFTLVPYA